MKKMKSNLDEQQELSLLLIESRGCWFAFWSLLLLILGQILLFGISDSMKYVAGEWIVFMCLSFYMMIACLKRGIWDRRIKASIKSNVIVSLIVAVGVGIFVTLIKVKDFPEKIQGCMTVGAIMGIVTFVLMLLCLEMVRCIYRKKVKELETEADEEEV